MGDYIRIVRKLKHCPFCGVIPKYYYIHMGRYYMKTCCVHFDFHVSAISHNLDYFLDKWDMRYNNG